MALFQQSSLTFGNAIDRVMEATSSPTTNTVMRGRATRAVQSAVKVWNKRGPWEFTKVVADSIAVVAGTATYALPFDVRNVYDVRLVVGTTEYPLAPAGRRAIDRTITTQDTLQQTPFVYDLYRQGGEGKIQLTPTPNANATLYIKYWRLLYVPCAIVLDNTTTVTNSPNVTALNQIAGVQIGAPVSVATGSAILSSTTRIKSLTSQSVCVLTENVMIGDVGSDLNVGSENYLLDFPMTYEDDLVNLASTIYLINNNEDTSRIDRFRQAAEDGLTRAAEEGYKNTDEDLSIMPPNDASTMQPLGMWNDGWGYW